LGADSPEAVGKLYSWGSTAGYLNGGSYEHSNDFYEAKFGGFTEELNKEEDPVITGYTAPYADMEIHSVGGEFNNPALISGARFDAAFVESDGELRLPNETEAMELTNNYLINQSVFFVGSQKFVRFTSLANGNSIVLPCGGWACKKLDDETDEDNDNWVERTANVWVDGGYKIATDINEQYANRNSGKALALQAVTADEDVDETIVDTYKRPLGLPIRGVEKGDWHGVDLGLTSGTIWADRNFGAPAPEEIGAWCNYGNITPIYSASIGADPDEDWRADLLDFTQESWNSTSGASALVTDSDARLSEDYDVAKYNSAENLAIPSWDQVQELFRECTLSVVTVNGKKCGKFVGTNGNYILVPFAGHYEGTTLTEAQGAEVISARIDPNYDSQNSVIGQFLFELDGAVEKHRTYVKKWFGFQTRPVVM
jgi:hypothetical protein